MNDNGVPFLPNRLSERFYRVFEHRQEFEEQVSDPHWRKEILKLTVDEILDAGCTVLSEKYQPHEVEELRTMVWALLLWIAAMSKTILDELQAFPAGLIQAVR